MFLALIINLITARVLLNALGVIDYGVFNVVAGFVSLFGVINATLSTSALRFYNFEGTIGGHDGFQKTYITVLIIQIIFAIILLLLLESIGMWYMNNVLVVPAERLFAAKVIFQASTISMMLLVLQVPYTGAVLAKEHMEFYAIINIFDVSLKLAIAIIVKYANTEKLILYGLLLSLIAVLDLIAYIVYCKHNFPEIKMQKYFDLKMYRSVLSFSGWNFIGTFAFMFKNQGINLLLNFYFGPIVNAARGIAYQVNSAINGFSLNILTAFNPQLVSSYAREDYQRTQKIMFSESKICFSLIALLITPIIFELPYLLHLWLRQDVPEHTTAFTVFVLIDSLICTLNTPCTQLIQATGNINKYQLGSSIVSLFLIIFCWIQLATGLESESVFISVIVFSIINQCVCLFFVNKQFQLDMKEYTRNIIFRCIILLLLLPIVPIIIQHFLSQSLLRALILITSSFLYGLLIIYLCVLDRTEKQFVINALQNIIKHSAYVTCSDASHNASIEKLN